MDCFALEKLFSSDIFSWSKGCSRKVLWKFKAALHLVYIIACSCHIKWTIPMYKYKKLYLLRWNPCWKTNIYNFGQGVTVKWLIMYSWRLYACVHVLIKIIFPQWSSPDAPHPAPRPRLWSYWDRSGVPITSRGSHWMKLHHGDRQGGKDLVLEHKGLDASEDPEED